MGGASTERRDLPQTLVVAMMLMTVLIVIDLTNKKCGASNITETILWKSNDTNYIAAYEDLETELQMVSEMSRRILQQNKGVAPNALDASKAVTCGSARGSNYRCGAGGSGSKEPICRSQYDRSCKRG